MYVCVHSEEEDLVVFEYISVLRGVATVVRFVAARFCFTQGQA